MADELDQRHRALLAEGQRRTRSEPTVEELLDQLIGVLAGMMRTADRTGAHPRKAGTPQ